MRETLKSLIGSTPSENGFRKRMRLHQGWWRTCVLVAPEGKHPIDESRSVCNTIINGQSNKRNFLTDNIVSAVTQTIEKRESDDRGLIQEDRLFNNLLSSQPLCFNFFGELQVNKKLALQVLRAFYPFLTEIKEIYFEFAPTENYTDDNSAFDMAMEVIADGKTGLIGLECKYTDSFSQPEYDGKAYRQIYQKSDAFKNKYKEFIQSKFNQLFRNQLIAEALVQHQKYDFVKTGLFCHHDDSAALNTAKQFQSMLNDGENVFNIITYKDFIAAIQRLELTWEQREFSMLLWARYCGTKLSEEISNEF